MQKYYSTDGKEWSTEKEAIAENKIIELRNVENARKERLNIMLSKLEDDCKWEWNFTKKRYKDDKLYIATQIGKHGNINYSFKGTNGLLEVFWEYFKGQMHPDYGFYTAQETMLVDMLKKWLKNEEKDLCSGYVLSRREHDYEEWEIEEMGKLYE